MTWTYNENDELLDSDSASYEYDDNGNMVKKTIGTDVTNYFYNLEDRLARVEDGTGTVIAEYYYDPFGKRLWKEVGGVRTYFLYSDEGLVGEYDSSGVELKAYGYQPNATFTTDPLFMKQGDDYYFYQNDHLGTPQKITAINGAVVWEARYTSFGEATIEPSSTITNNLRFPGQYFDEETGLHYNYYRYYDPGTGRYCRVDPIGFDGGINLFAYGEQNPLIEIDPFGLFCLCLEFISPAEGVKIAQEAKTWVDTPYKYGGHDKSGADCSGSTWKIYENAGYSYAAGHLAVSEFNESGTKCKMQKVNGTPQVGDVAKFGENIWQFMIQT